MPGLLRAGSAGARSAGVREWLAAKRRLTLFRGAGTRALVVLADQLSKRAVEHSIPAGDERKLLPGVDLVNTRNSGVAFGFLPGSHVWVTIIIALALAGLLVYFAGHRASPWIWLPTGMLVGGALGNLIDRLANGSVIDFIKLPAWPAFNIADMSITFGVIALVLVLELAHGDGG